MFYHNKWEPIGATDTLEEDTAAATNIDKKYLAHNGQCLKFSDASIATKMGWASGERPGIEDDMAYSMLGILGVSMDTRYGEGPNAFIRLQQDILDVSIDESIFVWKHKTWTENDTSGLLASSPACFRESGGMTIESGRYGLRSSQSSYEWKHGVLQS